MDLNSIQVFIKVVEASSFSEAGRLLGLPRAAVSRKVAKLEEELGVRLLQRTTRRLSLTDSGRLFYERCRHSIAGLEEARLQIAETQTTPRGRLRIAAHIEFGMYFIGKLIGRFMADYPELTVEVELIGRQVDMVAEGIDLMLCAFKLEDSSLIVRKIADVERGLYASGEYLAAHGTPKRVKELSTHQCILPVGRKKTLWQLDSPEGKVEVEVSGKISSNSITFMRDAAIGGLGIALIPSFLCQKAVADGRLIALLNAGKPISTEMYALYPSRRYLPSKVKVFLEFLKENMSRSV